MIILKVSVLPVMFGKLKAIIFTYPQQVVLLLINSSIFTWLQLNLVRLSQKTGLAETYATYAPGWLKSLTANSWENFQTFLNTSSWAWLVATLILVFLWRFISKVLRLILLLLLIGVGLYLVWQNQALFLGIAG